MAKAASMTPESLEALLLDGLRQESADRVHIKDADGRLRWLNHTAAAWLGLTPEAAVGRTDAEFFTEEHARQVLADEREILRTGVGLVNVIQRETWPDRPDTWVCSTKLPLRDGSGEIIGTWVISRDATQRVQAERLLAERSATLGQVQRDLLTVLDGSPDGMMRFDPELRHVYLNPAAERALGLPAAEVIGRTSCEIGHPREHALWEQALHQVLETGTGTELEYVDSVDARARWFQARMVPEKHADGTVTGVLVAVRDFTDRKRAQDTLAFQASHDPLTGLANRGLLLDRVAHALRRMDHSPGQVGLLFVDLDRFKTVNDTLGHAAGDWFLHQVGQRVSEAARRSDTVSRFGGDEFVVLCEGLRDDEDIRTVADRVCLALSEPLVYRGQSLPVSASIGIVTSDSPDASAERLVADADAAMYQAKRQGGGRYEFFDADLRERALARTGLMLELHRALERQEFRLHYQPVLRLADQTCVGVEALVRWQHPTRGLLMPAAFLDVAEQSHFMVELGAWILDEACRQLALWWLGQGGSRVSMSVNVSARQFAAPGFVQAVADALHRHRIDPRMLCLEITETALLEDSAAVPETFAGLVALGVRIALDDSGTGYSSLAHLRRFPVHILKVDRSFVSGLGHAEGDLAIVSAVTAMARALGITTIAEGIETAGQLALLTAMGCDNGQGYLFSMAVEPHRVTEILDAGSPYQPCLSR